MADLRNNFVGIKSPNPGETFVQLRYGYNF